MSSQNLNRITKQAALATTAALAGSVGMAGDAAADMLELTPFQADFTLELGKITSQTIDINNDWRPDFKLRVFQSGGKEVATISALNPKLLHMGGNGDSYTNRPASVDQIASIDGNLPLNGDVAVIGGGQMGQIFVTPGLSNLGPSTGNNFVRRFKPGEEVFTKGNSVLGDVSVQLSDYDGMAQSDMLAPVASFYEDLEGPFTPGSGTGYIGLVLDIFEGQFVVTPLDIDDVNDNAIRSVQDVVTSYPDSNGDYTDFDGYPIDGGNVMVGGVTRFFAWLEVERGSLTVTSGQTQFLTPGAPAPIPQLTNIDVPEPATLPLMALGAAGLAALRRRKAA